MISKILFTMLDFPLFWYLGTDKGVAMTALLAKRARKELEVFIVMMGVELGSRVVLNLLGVVCLVGSKEDMLRTWEPFIVVRSLDHQQQ